MKRFVFLLMLIPALLDARANIEQQISEASLKISSFDHKYKNLNSQMTRTARAILKEKREILRQQKRLEELQLELSINEESFGNNQAELKKLKSQQTSLNSAQNEVEQKLVFALARNISLAMLVDDKRAVSAEALITEEVLKRMAAQVKQEINGLNKEFEQNTQRIASLEGRMSELEKVISGIEEKRTEVVATQRANKKALKKLETKKRRYKASIDDLLKKQNALKKTLAELNIIKDEEKRKARQSRTVRQQAVASKNLPKVKQRGSSYQKIKTKRYRGKKTIAPIDDYQLVKKFGPYTDPIYDIKIFNESISLKPRRANAMVKNVLNGKVILAQNTSLLDNVVIVEHADGMHTIYAHLDKIAPTIKKGKKIKKGSVIGRVNRELMFEVTQKNYHINPVELIY
jgi:murein DD-endopeptidase MepM/ murein hydrolase activator NlpD